jgi:hypothetical protein
VNAPEVVMVSHTPGQVSMVIWFDSLAIMEQTMIIKVCYRFNHQQVDGLTEEFVCLLDWSSRLMDELLPIVHRNTQKWRVIDHHDPLQRPTSRLPPNKKELMPPASGS